MYRVFYERIIMQHINPQGRVFTFIRTEPYTTKAGRKTQLKVWQARCEHLDCDEIFTVKTPISDEDNSSSQFFYKHCPEHRMTREESMRYIAQRKQKITDEQVAELRNLAKEGYSTAALALIYPISERTIRAIISGYRR